jgi:ribosomal protein L7/L12
MSNTQEANQEVQQLLAEGKKQHAVEYLRDTFQISEDEANALVNALENEYQALKPSSTTLSGNIKIKVVEFLNANKKMEAIRHVREQTGTQLKAALELVEEVEKEINPNFKPAGGCVGGVFKLVSIFFFGVSFLLLVGAGLSYYLEEESIKKSDLIKGRVVSLTPSDHDGTETYAPVVRYVWHEKERTYQSNMYSYPPAYDVGEEVELYVNREDPENVYINSFSDRWLVVTILGGIGSVFLVIAVILTVIGRKVR